MNLHSLLFVAALTSASLANAHEFEAGDLRIDHPYARPTIANLRTSTAYLTLENKGKSADKLISLSSPVAQSVEMHTMSMENGVMKMREVPSIELKPGEKVTMRPGDGYHLMLMGLTQPLKAGNKFPMTLSFEKAGKKEISVWVENKPGETTHQH